MPETNTRTNVTPAARAGRVWERVRSRAQSSTVATGPEIRPEVVREEAERELREQRQALEEVHAADREAALAALQLQKEGLDAQLTRTRAALRDAQAKATQIGPVSGTVADWEKRLAKMPPLARFEIVAWREAALRRLAAIGTTQADVMIVRLADISLMPYDEANAETH